MSNPGGGGGGGGEHGMIEHIGTRARDAFVFGSDFGY